MTFKRCRRLWDYTSYSRQSLGSAVPRTAFSLGSMVHQSLAQYLLEPTADLGTLFAHACANEQEAMKAAYLARIGAEMSDFELAPFHEMFELGLAMMKNYQRKWASPLFRGFSIVQPESQIEIAIPDTDHSLILRLDGIIRQDGTDKLYILEHKTYASRPKMQDLQNNDQFLAYIWGLTQAKIGNVVGIAYDGMWKRAVPPRNSTFDELFTRLIVTRPQHEIDAFGAQLAMEVLDMVRAKEQNIIYPNRIWQGCWDCSFQALCESQSRGEDYQHIIDTQYVKVDQDKQVLPIED